MYPQTFQQTPYAMYGSPRSFYGNIQYGTALDYIKGYGAWPEERPAQRGMLTGDWQEPEPIVVKDNRVEEIASRVAIIRELKAQIDIQHDLFLKNQLREQIRIEREAKERAFKLQTRMAEIDEEESTFILLN